ncbi:RNA polymerase sigma factor SigJ [Micromonospora halotolerans]|uniref:RNA polymerase sigma factor SigJ n=1 Tax=Micromonospora halotolerans TaxID=709879 RepID=A0ABY9ZVK3_9ACTN|nr:RNA polymerase sigma factor SigJ [Micromonospora halotolerans]WNM39319.1 RNA polymerase sigma factor SigJ [Micromonospora halotolerans]
MQHETVFAAHRSLLMAVAYRVLGRASDTEDVVQDAWLRWSAVDIGQVDDPEGFLVRVTTRLAIDRLRSAAARREAYVGPWLPEPILTAPDVADDVARAESVSLAVLLILESLSPLERAVFVLHEAFGYSHNEIAEIVERSPESVRQTAVRARQHVSRHRRRYDTDQATRRKVTESFMSASAGGDLTALMEVLAPDVRLVCDGGGLAPAPRKAIDGIELVARALVTFAGRMPESPRVVMTEVNGGPGIVIYSTETPVVVVVLHLVEGRAREIHLISNPEKLTAIGGL